MKKLLEKYPLIWVIVLIAFIYAVISLVTMWIGVVGAEEKLLTAEEYNKTRQLVFWGNEPEIILTDEPKQDKACPCADRIKALEKRVKELEDNQLTFDSGITGFHEWDLIINQDN